MRRTRNQTCLAAVLAASLGLLSACATSGTRVDQAQLGQFKPGVTTVADIESALGKPQSTNLASDGTRSIGYLYSHAQVKGATFIPIVGIFAGGATAQGSSVIFRFDTAGRLIDYHASQQDVDVNSVGGSTAH